MSTGAIILLGAFAGLTIFLGLPLAFLRRGTPSMRMFLSMLATGVLAWPGLRSGGLRHVSVALRPRMDAGQRS